MTAPSLAGISPNVGPASGGGLVRITGADFADRVEVFFDDAPASVLNVHHDAGLDIADVRAPAHAQGRVDVTLQNLDPSGSPVPGEADTLPDAYRFLRSKLAGETDFIRLVRALLRELKRQVLSQVSMTVAVDYRDAESGELELVTVAEIPSVVLSGPRISENRFYALNEGREDVVPGPAGPELARHRPPYTVDLAFTITAVSDHTVELLNLMAAVGIFLGRNRWLTLPRDPFNPALGSVAWELDPDGDIRPQLDGPDDLRAFTCGLVVRGFDLDEGQPIDRGKAVSRFELGTFNIERSTP